MCGSVGFRVIKKVLMECFGLGRIALDAIIPEGQCRAHGPGRRYPSLGWPTRGPAQPPSPDAGGTGGRGQWAPG